MFVNTNLINNKLGVCEMKENVVCPICCVGRNSKKLGGNHICFHCDTCGWFACCVDIPDGDYSVDNKIKSHLRDIEKRLRKYYSQDSKEDEQ